MDPTFNLTDIISLRRHIEASADASAGSQIPYTLELLGFLVYDVVLFHIFAFLFHVAKDLLFLSNLELLTKHKDVLPEELYKLYREALESIKPPRGVKSLAASATLYFSFSDCYPFAQLLLGAMALGTLGFDVWFSICVRIVTRAHLVKDELSEPILNSFIRFYSPARPRPVRQ